MPDWREDNALEQTGAVPDFYWSGETEMRCISATVGDLLERGWTHHIPRLMLLGNYALLAGASPQALTEWFHSMYVDGYDWVMVPNVIGMSQWADGGVMATKPYAASSNYINRMTDYCGGCAYDRTTRTEDDSCPFNSLLGLHVAPPPALRREPPDGPRALDSRSLRRRRAPPHPRAGAPVPHRRLTRCARPGILARR
jgi:deoxyribodipyrimidine photolyase-related protein